jgi:CheY-like chemotaxis protein
MADQAKTVLVVDDEEFNRDILNECLQDAGYRVLLAIDGRQGLAELAAHPETDLIVLDRMMPGIDGLEVLRRIKADARCRDLPIIMQTAAAATQQILEGIQAGAFYYLTKPYERGLLLAIVETACADRERLREMQRTLAGQQAVMGLLDEGRFHFRTFEEAKSLAHVVAACCPNPDQVAFGLCELMINAVEHGNLAIGYAEKTALVRAGTWQQEIERRLRLPENLGKQAVLEFVARDGQIHIVIRDQGQGFAWRDFLEISPCRAGDPHGRGVAMARALSFASLEYRGCGNEAVCTVNLPARVDHPA